MANKRCFEKKNSVLCGVSPARFEIMKTKKRQKEISVKTK